LTKNSYSPAGYVAVTIAGVVMLHATIDEQYCAAHFSICESAVAPRPDFPHAPEWPHSPAGVVITASVTANSTIAVGNTLIRSK
jgi:hypothetical protein